MRLPAPKTADRRGVHEGRPYELWLPDSGTPSAGMVILHGAGSRKENHADFARACCARGWAALSYDQRGHGDSTDEMSPQAIADVGRMARYLASAVDLDPDRVCLRGSSMGGLIAIHAAAVTNAIAGAIAICPGSERGLLRELRAGRLEMRADNAALEPWLEEHDLRETVELCAGKPLLILHARGDEVIPYAWSEELHRRAGEPRELIIVPGGHHRSIQHDGELQEVALGWLEKALSRRR
jgi:alpha-beta hydrolase superfamily lysophospholipase